MRLLISNKITAAMITVNNESTAFPKANMINNNLIEKTFFTDYIDIDFGSAVTIDAIALVSASTGITLSANSTPAWGSPPFTTVITSEVTFINESYRYWRISKTGDFFINYFYLGEFLQMPGVEDFPTPQEITTDVVSTTQSGQIYTTPGITFKTQEFSFPYTIQADYDAFKTWWKSDDRTNNIFLVPFESDMDIFEPYFCKVLSNNIGDRSRLAYSWSITVQEAK